MGWGGVGMPGGAQIAFQRKPKLGAIGVETGLAARTARPSAIRHPLSSQNRRPTMGLQPLYCSPR